MVLEEESSEEDETMSTRILTLNAVSRAPQGQKWGEELFGRRLVKSSGALGA